MTMNSSHARRTTVRNRDGEAAGKENDVPAAVPRTDGASSRQGLLEAAASEPPPVPREEEEPVPLSGGPLDGRIALVTGGTGGIGRATVRRLLYEGARVATTGRNREKLEREKAALEEKFGKDRVQAVLCDVTEADSVVHAFEEVVSRWGGLDILVNNAGLSFGGSVEETSPGDYDRLNDVMPRGSFLCSREAARIMREQGRGGDIVYIVSKNAVYAGPKNIAYGTAKAAQLHQARLLAVELAEIGVRVNVVNPDAVVRGSGIFAGGWGAERARAYGVKEEDLGKYYAQRTLLKREILPENVAAAVFVLVGPDLRKSTGLVINVDGGFPPAMMR